MFFRPHFLHQVHPLIKNSMEKNEGEDDTMVKHFWLFFWFPFGAKIGHDRNQYRQFM